ncbi:MAG TPA: hypothetical protein VGV15_00370 [Terriglobales bacterium]|nr:hypothetical protein [Terriglobales bacterium]
MPSSKKKSKSKQRKSKRATVASTKKTARSKQVVGTKTPKKLTKKRTVQKKTALKASGGRKRRGSLSTEREIQREIQNKNRTAAGLISARQSGDLQGLSRAEQADSESVDELVEEGNLFEAGAVAGVEEADNADEKEVHTHELPEDDVPEEYLDKD